MWKSSNWKNLNYVGIKRIAYVFTDEDLGKKQEDVKKRHRKAYAKIFQQKAEYNIKNRLNSFNQSQTNVKQQNNEQKTIPSEQQ